MAQSNEQGGFNERLDEALALIKYSVEYRETHGGCPPEVSAIKRHGVAEAKAAICTLIIEELEANAIDAQYYIPNSPDDTYTSGEVVQVSVIKKVLGDTHGTK